MNKACIVIFVLLLTASTVAAQPGVGADFLDVLSNRAVVSVGKASRSKTSGSSFDLVCPINVSTVAKRLLSEYGAMFVASEELVSPPTCRFQNDAEVTAFQSRLTTSFVIVIGVQMQFQKAAAESLNAVIVEALKQWIRIRPLDGAIAGGRSYSDTVRLWNSRFEPALRYWVGRKRIPMDEAAAVTQMTLEQQVGKVMEWEAQGMRFGTNRGSSIFASTAPPGASQHLSLIAIDVAPPVTPTLIALMNSHGWFQTVKGDRPHFTYLGFKEKELPGRGLKALLFEGTQYWVPNISSDNAANP
jgi:hypothetical protein